MKTLFYSNYHFSFVKRVSLALLLVLLFNGIDVPIYGQSDGGDEEDYGWYYSLENQEQETPSPTKVERLTMLRYETFATVFFHVELWSADSDNDIFYKQLNSDDDIFSVVPDESGNVILNDLPLDNEFEVLIQDTVGQLTKLGHFTTYEVFEEMEMISLDANLFNPISSWLNNPNNQNFYDFVANLEGVHLHEKINVMQQFLYYGLQLKDAWAGALPPNPQTLDWDDPGLPPIPRNKDCLCRPLRLTVSDLISPFNGDEPIDEKNGNYKAAYGGVEPTGFKNNRGRRWHAYGMKGPAKYQQVWIETRKCVNNYYGEGIGYTNEVLDGEGENYVYAEPNIAQLKYVFACIGVDDYMPEDCQCERQMQVDVCYRYDVHGYAESDQKGVACWNGRRAAAVASDYTFLAWKENEYSDDEFVPLDGVELQVAVGCESTPNWAEFLVNVGLAAFYAYKAIVASPSDGFIPALYSAYASNSLKEQIEQVSQTPIIKRSGTCGVEQGWNSMKGCKKLDLNINQTMVVALISSSRVYAEGLGLYHANARILSSYGLVGSLQKSDPDQTGEVCCRTGHGIYSVATVPTENLDSDVDSAPATIPPLDALQEWVREMFLGQGIDLIDDISNINGEYGYRGGGARRDCLLEIVDSRNDKNENNEIVEAGLKSTTQLQQLGKSVWLRSSTPSAWHFSVFDLGGRILTETRGSDSNTELLNLEQQPWPTGLYLGVWKSDDQTIPIKIIHSH